MYIANNAGLNPVGAKKQRVAPFAVGASLHQLLCAKIVYRATGESGSIYSTVAEVERRYGLRLYLPCNGS